MTFVIITHVPHLIKQNSCFAYGPYVREMNIWIQYCDEVIIVAPQTDMGETAIDSSYMHENINFVSVESFDLLSLKGLYKTIMKIPKISWQLYAAMQQADHIHLRCPGNIGLIGCFIQILFPKKPKTAKYAGNWDRKSIQPWTYQLQKWILSNTFITRNMQVLVYGEWEGSTKNIKSFFTASYSEADKTSILNKEITKRIDFIFVGTLVIGKNPLYAIQLVESLARKGYDVHLDLYGEGVERPVLEQYIRTNIVENIVLLKGNQTSELIKSAYQNSHFVVLPSDSEGWPKVIAEGMFWGCVPLATPVSCVPFMLDYGLRGLLLQMDIEKDILQMEAVLNSQTLFNGMQKEGTVWSRGYTLDIFEEEIKKLLLGS